MLPDPVGGEHEAHVVRPQLRPPHLCVCVRARARVRACVRECVRARVIARVASGCVWVCDCVRANKFIRIPYKQDLCACRCAIVCIFARARACA